MWQLSHGLQTVDCPKLDESGLKSVVLSVVSNIASQLDGCTRKVAQDTKTNNLFVAQIRSCKAHP